MVAVRTAACFCGTGILPGRGGPLHALEHRAAYEGQRSPVTVDSSPSAWFIEAAAARAGWRRGRQRIRPACTVPSSPRTCLALVAAQLINRHALTPPSPPTRWASAPCMPPRPLLLWFCRRASRVTARSPRVSATHWWSLIGIDLLLFGALHSLDASSVNYCALFVMPVPDGWRAVPTLTGPGQAAAMATLALLVPELWSLLTNDVGSLRFTAGGLVGGGSLRWPC